MLYRGENDTSNATRIAGTVTEDGWHIDDIVIRGFDDPPPGLIFRDSFESSDTLVWSTVVR